MKSQRAGIGTIAIAVLGLWCSAGQPAASQTPARQPEQTARQRCTALQGALIPADAIGLPTSGGVVVSASFVTATDAGNRNGEFCKVLGSIHPVDPLAPDIKFQLNLPTKWNNRSLQMGGGGFDGSVVTGLGGASNQVAAAPTPLAQGYVTLGQRLRTRRDRLRRHLCAQCRSARELRSPAGQEDARCGRVPHQGALRRPAEAFVLRRRIPGRARSAHRRAKVPGRFRRRRCAVSRVQRDAAASRTPTILPRRSTEKRNRGSTRTRSGPWWRPSTRPVTGWTESRTASSATCQSATASSPWRR